MLGLCMCWRCWGDVVGGGMVRLWRNWRRGFCVRWLEKRGWEGRLLGGGGRGRRTTVGLAWLVRWWMGRGFEGSCGREGVEVRVGRR